MDLYFVPVPQKNAKNLASTKLGQYRIWICLCLFARFFFSEADISNTRNNG